jgi:hypothetical protein
MTYINFLLIYINGLHFSEICNFVPFLHVNNTPSKKDRYFMKPAFCVCSLLFKFTSVLLTLPSYYRF